MLADVTRALAARGIGSPRVDAEVLVAHVLGVQRARLAIAPNASESQRAQLWALVDRRCAREPLQHLTGTAGFRRLDLAVGRGVFVPRPETEVLVEHVLRSIDAIRVDEPGRPVRVAEFGAGSAAIALSLATEASDVHVQAVEISPEAMLWAVSNVAAHQSALVRSNSTVALIEADAGDPGVVAGPVDLVVANPPYIPDGAVPRDPEVRDHDPALALYGGPDGLDVIRRWIDTAAGVLRPGGGLFVEHGDEQGETGADASMPALLRRDPRWSRVSDHPDLAGRPRVTSATRRS